MSTYAKFTKNYSTIFTWFYFPKAYGMQAAAIRKILLCVLHAVPVRTIQLYFPYITACPDSPQSHHPHPTNHASPLRPATKIPGLLQACYSFPGPQLPASPLLSTVR